MNLDKESGHGDVHFSRGLVCMDCHSAREMHGDGTKYDSMKQDGAMDAKCENCHDGVTLSESHTVHNGKLDCKACHTRHVLSCSNCHFDTLIKEGKKVAIPLSGWTFLMNYKDKVTSANMQSFLVKDKKTFLLFAPNMSHSIMKDGRKCDECHLTEITEQIKSGKIELIRIKNGKTENIKGVIPVVDGVDYKCAFQDRKDGKWVPVDNPDTPLIQFAGYGKPLTKEQLENL